MFLGIGLTLPRRGGIHVAGGGAAPGTAPTTWSPTDKHAGIVLSNGNLTAQKTTTGFGNVRSTSGYVSNGKWYFEVVIGAANTDGAITIGIARPTASLTGNVGLDAGLSFGYRPTRTAGAEKIGNFVQSAYGAVAVVGDVIGVLLDLDAGTLTFTKNGVSQGVAFSSGLTGFPWKAVVSLNSSGGLPVPINGKFKSSDWTTVPVGFTEFITQAGGGVYPTLDPATVPAGVTLSESNLRAANTSGSGSTWRTVSTTKALGSGKYYWEVTGIQLFYGGFEVALIRDGYNPLYFPGGDANGWCFQVTSTLKWNNFVNAPYGSAGGYSANNNDRFSVTYDGSTGTITMWANGKAQGVLYAGVMPTGNLRPALGLLGNATTTDRGDGRIHFDPTSWLLTPPTGYVALEM
jgi:hypothetical protein